MKKLYIVLGAVVVVVGFMMLRGGPGSLVPAAREPVEVEGLDDAAMLVQVAQGMTRGDSDAPVTIVEFGDYQCPGCGFFAATVEPLILSTYVESDKAKFVFYDFPIPGLHPKACLAARAARCGGDQGRYWEYHDMLFGNQVGWSTSSNPTNIFVGYAGQIGLDEGMFEGCLRSDQHAATVSANMKLGEELGVTGTPTVMVSSGGMYRAVGGNTFEAIQQVVDELLGEDPADGGS